MTVQLARANSIRIPLADESVHCCITSPPFFGLRDYGLPPVVWGPERCRHGGEHEWGNEKIIKSTAQQDNGPGGGVWNAQSRGTEPSARRTEFVVSTGQFCQHCDAWRGCLGLEPTPDLYVAHLVEVFREVRRVLRNDGVVWLNLGASYASQPSWGRGGGSTLDGGKPHPAGAVRHSAGYKPKDLIPIPWLVALALQADGWWLRSAPPWLKKNCLPESVRDRPTTAHEYWFLLSKKARYFYDAEAIRLPLKESSIERGNYGWGGKTGDALKHGATPSGGGFNRLKRTGEKMDQLYNPAGRNRRTTDTFFESLDALIADQRRYLRHLERVRDNGGMLLDEDGDPLALVFNTKGYAGAHYATFNPDMIEPLVKCSTSERGVCPRCGAPWERVVERRQLYERDDTGRTKSLDHQRLNSPGAPPEKGWQSEHHTTGWQPTCDCDAGDPVPAVVLDPFVGSGTVPMVARKLGRRSVGFDLSFDYLRDQARVRLELDKLTAWHNGGQQVQAAWDELPLFAGAEKG